MRILFVEDELALNEIAQAQFARGGHKVVTAQSVSQAEEILREEVGNIDCVISDHRLPDGYGVAFCVQCRVRYPHLLVAVVSGCLTKKDIALMEEYDVPYWLKPAIYSRVAEELHRQRLSRLSGGEGGPGGVSQAPSASSEERAGTGSAAEEKASRSGLLRRLFRNRE